MLYQLFDGYKEIIQPVNYLSKTFCRNRILNDERIKNRKIIKHVKASAELTEQFTRRYEKPDFALDHTEVDGREVPITEKIVMSKPFCDLINFKREGSENDPRLLLVAPLAGHYASLTRDTVRQFLPDHDVYLTDWRNVRDIPVEEGEFGFDDFVSYLIDFLRFMGPGSNLMAACQPCPGALVATAALAMEDDPAQPSSLVLMAGPVDPRIKQMPFVRYLGEKNLTKLA